MTADLKTYHMMISGRVQGVFFRDNARKKAKELGITGFVKNLDTGGVEVVAQGNEDVLKLFVEWCSRGPAWSKVDNVAVEKTQESKFDDFKILL